MDRPATDADAWDDDEWNRRLVYQQMNVIAKRLNLVRGHFLGQALVLLIVIFGTAIIVRADGGNVLWQQTTGPITVTAFGTQNQLRPGPADFSFLVENTEQRRPVLDASLFVALENENGVTIRGEATHDQARNKLLYCSVMNLAISGKWRMKVIVTHGSENYDFVKEVEVREPQSPLIVQWRLIVLPFTIIILFVVHQRLAWKERTLP